jgi:glycosyltransferase involved in cell wall biosynthesis
VRAFARYRLRGGRCDLVLAGPGPDPAAAPRAVRSLGWIDDPALLALYDGAQALVVASESEGYGLPVLEAFARGVPVVAFAAGGVVEAAGDAAVLVPPGDEEGLAEALLRIESDAAHRASLVERGRRRAAASRWPDAARKLVAVLREAAGTT